MSVVLLGALLLALGLSSGAIDDPPLAIPTPAEPRPTPASAQAALIQQIERQLIESFARLETQANKVREQVGRSESLSNGKEEVVPTRD